MWSNDTDIGLQGFCEDAFLPMKTALEENFLAGLEVGASLAATWRGKPVMDLWGGKLSEERVHPWQSDTLTPTYSIGKIPAAMCVLVLVDRRLIELDTPVAAYWPEFGQQGKDKITVREALSQRALVPGFAEPQPNKVLLDWDRMCELVAAEKPWFPRGTVCYHPVNFGIIMGELVRRVSGMSFEAFFEAEFRAPLDADFHFTITDPSDLDRLSEQIPTAELPFEPGSVEDKVFNCFIVEKGSVTATSLRAALSPALWNYGNGRSLAAIGSVIANRGEVAGHRYLSASMVDEAMSEQVDGMCPCLGRLRYGLGLGLDSPGWAAPTPDCVHWGGYGGHFLFMDPIHQVSVGYAMNLGLMMTEFDGVRWHGPILDRQQHMWDSYLEVLNRLGQ
jgi:CubicO group peptidase (beta-lactamase class C family)